MYELKEIGKVFTSKSVGTGPSSYEKRSYRAAILQSLRNTELEVSAKSCSLVQRSAGSVRSRNLRIEQVVARSSVYRLRGRNVSNSASWSRTFTSGAFVFDARGPQWAMASSFTRFLDRTQRRTTISRTPLDEWSVRRRDLCLTTHDTHNRHPSMPPVGFEPTISAGERPQTDALNGAALGTGTRSSVSFVNISWFGRRS